MPAFHLLLVLTTFISPTSAAPEVIVGSEELSVREPVAQLYAAAHRVQELSDGSRFIIYRSPLPAEPSALAATLVAPDGSLTTLTASDWVPEGEIAAHTIGQIYSAAISPDNELMVVSLGWRHPLKGGSNALAVLSRTKGSWQFSHLLRGLGSVGDVAFAKDGIIAAVTGSRPDTDGVAIPPLLTLLTPKGRILLETIPASSLEPDLSLRNASRVSVAGDLYRFFDAEQMILTTFRLRLRMPVDRQLPIRRNLYVEAGVKEDASIELVDSISIDQDVNDLIGAVVEDAGFLDDGRFALVYSALPPENNGMALRVVIRSPDGSATKWDSTSFWKPVLWTRNALVGIERGRTPLDNIFIRRATFEPGRKGSDQ